MNPYRRRKPSITPYQRPVWIKGGGLLPWIVKLGDQKVFCPGKIITVNAIS